MQWHLIAQCHMQSGACTVAVHVLYRHLWLDMDMDMGTQVPGRQQAQEGDDLEAVTLAWCCKRLSNLDYLLHLNRLAGRRYGDPTFHPFLPWSAPPPPAAYFTQYILLCSSSYRLPYCLVRELHVIHLLSVRKLVR